MIEGRVIENGHPRQLVCTRRTRGRNSRFMRLGEVSEQVRSGNDNVSQSPRSSNASLDSLPRVHLRKRDRTKSNLSSAVLFLVCASALPDNAGSTSAIPSWSRRR